MESLITSNQAVAVTLCIVIATAFSVQHFKYFKFIGPVVTILALGILLGHMHILPHMLPVYGVIMTYAIPMGIILLALSVDIVDLKKLNRHAFAALIVLFCVVAGACVLFGVLLTPYLADSYKLAAMYAGTYTGGSVNLNAVAHALDSPKDLIVAANTSDYAIGIPFLVFYFIFASTFMKTKRFKAFWPTPAASAVEESDGPAGDLFAKRHWGIGQISILLGIAALILQISFTISSLFPSEYASTVRLLLAVTIGLAAGHLPGIRRMEGAADLGTYFLIAFMLVLGLMLDFSIFFQVFSYALLMCILVLFSISFVHLGVCRLLRIPPEYAFLALVAGTADGSTASILANSAAWKTLIPVGLLMGTIAGQLGTYIALFVGYAVRLFV